MPVWDLLLLFKDVKNVSVVLFLFCTRMMGFMGCDLLIAKKENCVSVWMTLPPHAPAL